MFTAAMFKDVGCLLLIRQTFFNIFKRQATDQYFRVVFQQVLKLMVLLKRKKLAIESKLYDSI